MQNKIKELRTQLSITQRELADMVGTSQQQIQRIETGKVAAKLGLAQAISAVLKKPLNAVFPVTILYCKKCVIKVAVMMMIWKASLLVVLKWMAAFGR